MRGGSFLIKELSCRYFVTPGTLEIHPKWEAHASVTTFHKIRLHAYKLFKNKNCSKIIISITLDMPLAELDSLLIKLDSMSANYSQSTLCKSDSLQQTLLSSAIHKFSFSDKNTFLAKQNQHLMFPKYT